MLWLAFPMSFVTWLSTVTTSTATISIPLEAVAEAAAVVVVRAVVEVASSQALFSMASSFYKFLLLSVVFFSFGVLPSLLSRTVGRRAPLTREVAPTVFPFLHGRSCPVLLFRGLSGADGLLRDSLPTPHSYLPPCKSSSPFNSLSLGFLPLSIPLDLSLSASRARCFSLAACQPPYRFV